MGHAPTLLGTQRVRPQLSHCGARRPVGEAVILQDDTAHTQSKIPVTYNTPHSGSWLTQTLSLTLFPLIHSAPATPASLLFLDDAKFIPTSGPLHLLFPPPRKLFCQTIICLTPSKLP